MRAPHSVSWQRRTAFNAMASAAAQVLSKLSTFAWTAVAARELTQTDFGTFSFVLSLGLILAALAEWGFDVGIVTRGSADGGRRLDEEFRLGFGAETSLAIIAFTVVGVVVGVFSLHTTSARLVLLFMLAATLLDSCSDTIRAGAQAAQRQGAVSAALSAARLLTGVVAIPVLLLGGGVVGLALSVLVSYLLGLAAHVAAARRIGLSFSMRGVTPGQMSRLFRQTALLGGSILVLAALSRFDSVLLEALSGSREVAAYSTSYRLFDTVLFAAFAVAGAVLPVLNSDPENWETQRALLSRVTAGLTALYLPFLVVCLAEPHEVLRVLFGALYGRESAGSLEWLAPAPLVFAASYVSSTVLISLGHARRVLVAAVVAAVVNVAGNLVAIPLLGGTGAAILTTGAYGLQAAILIGSFPRELRTVRQPLWLCLPAVIASGALALVLALGGATLVVLLGGLVVYLLVWLGSLRLLQPQELSSLLHLVRTRGRTA